MSEIAYIEKTQGRATKVAFFDASAQSDRVLIAQAFLATGERPDTTYGQRIVRFDDFPGAVSAAVYINLD